MCLSYIFFCLKSIQIQEVLDSSHLASLQNHAASSNKLTPPRNRSAPGALLQQPNGTSSSDTTDGNANALDATDSSVRRNAFFFKYVIYQQFLFHLILTFVFFSEHNVAISAVTEYGFQLLQILYYLMIIHTFNIDFSNMCSSFLYFGEQNNRLCLFNIFS